MEHTECIAKMFCFWIFWSFSQNINQLASSNMFFFFSAQIDEVKMMKFLMWIGLVLSLLMLVSGSNMTNGSFPQTRIPPGWPSFDDLNLGLSRFVLVKSNYSQDRNDFNGSYSNATGFSILDVARFQGKSKSNDKKRENCKFFSLKNFSIPLNLISISKKVETEPSPC